MQARLTDGWMNVAVDLRTRHAGTRRSLDPLLWALARAAEPERLRLSAVVHGAVTLPPGVAALELPPDWTGRAGDLPPWLHLLRALDARNIHLLHGAAGAVPLGRVDLARVVSLHDNPDGGGWLRGPRRWVERVHAGALARAADGVVVPSQWAAAALRERDPSLGDKVTVVPAGAAPDAVRHRPDRRRQRALLNRLGVCPGEFLCCVPSGGPAAEVVAPVVEAFCRADLGDLALVLLDEDGTLASREWGDERVLAATDLDGCARLDLQSAAAALVHPGNVDQGAGVVLDALALGVPVVSAALPSVREGCRWRVRLVPQADVRGWEEALGALAGAGGRPWHPRTLDQVAADLVVVYRRALAAWAGRRAGTPETAERVTAAGRGEAAGHR